MRGGRGRIERARVEVEGGKIMSDNTLWAIFWIGLFTCTALSNIASDLFPYVKRKDKVDKSEEN